METKKKLRKALKAADAAIRALARRIETMERCVLTQPKPGGASIDIPVVDTAGEAVLGCRDRFSARRFGKMHSVTLVRFVQELEEVAGIEIRWSQNEDKVVVYDAEDAGDET